MTADLTRLATELGLTLESPETLPGAMSGSLVVPVWTSDDTPAVLKVTEHTSADARAQARREHDAYTRLAPTLPVRIPELLHAQVSPARTVLVLRRHEPARPAQAWTRHDWAATVDALAALHDAPLPADPTPWTWTPWAGLDPVHDRAALDGLWNTEQTQGALTRVLVAQDELGRLAEAVLAVLTHGDCHTGNILGATGQPIFSDWASARIAPATDDLAFLLLRATAESPVAPPREAMLTRYATLRGLPLDLVDDAVRARQVLTLALQYPAFAAYLDAPTIARLHALFVACAPT